MNHSKKGQEITAEDLFIPDQDVGAAHADISPKGWAQAEEFFGTSEIRIWGHSHVDFAAEPSNMDRKTTWEIAANWPETDDWFIRLIINNSGDMNAALILPHWGIDTRIPVEVDWGLNADLVKQYRANVHYLPDRREDLVNEWPIGSRRLRIGD